MVIASAEVFCVHKWCGFHTAGMNFPVHTTFLTIQEHINLTYIFLVVTLIMQRCAFWNMNKLHGIDDTWIFLRVGNDIVYLVLLVIFQFPCGLFAANIELHVVRYVVAILKLVSYFIKFIVNGGTLSSYQPKSDAVFLRRIVLTHLEGERLAISVVPHVPTAALHEFNTSIVHVKIATFRPKVLEEIGAL